MNHSQRAFDPESLPPRITDTARTWLRVADAGLRALESVAWDVRAVAEETSADLFRVGGESRRRLARGARMMRAGRSLAVIAGRYRLEMTRAAFVSEARARRGLDDAHTANAARFLALAEALGGGYVKIGQMIGARPDLVPHAWSSTLGPLQDAAPPVDFEQIRAVVEEDLGGALEERFASFDPEPIAAASIGQVHLATTLDGERVAVKVQRPGIAERIDADLALLEPFLVALSKGAAEEGVQTPDLRPLARHTRLAVMEELDYGLERENMTTVGEGLAAIEGVRVPRALAELSAARVLTSTYEVGEKITAVLDRLAVRRDEGDESASEQLDRVLSRVLQMYMHQVLHLGAFQADPHPGNLLVDGDEVVLLDFGCTGVLGDARRAEYRALLAAIMLDDRVGAARCFEALGFRTKSGSTDTLHAVAEALVRDLRAAIDGRGEWTRPEEILSEVARLSAVASEDPIEVIPDDFILLARVFGTLGGLFVTYRPRTSAMALTL